MKKLFLVYLILAALIACGENHSPTPVYTLVIGFGETEGEGVVLTREGTGPGTRYLLALFRGKTPYRQRLVSEALFTQVRKSFFDYYKKEKRREPLRPFCQLRLRSVVTEGDRPGTVRSLCLDSLDKNAVAEIGNWYRLVRSL